MRRSAAAVLRHQFGGGVLHAWESAAVALHYLDGFEERYQRAVRSGEELLRSLEEKKVRVETRSRNEYIPVDVPIGA